MGLRLERENASPEIYTRTGKGMAQESRILNFVLISWASYFASVSLSIK
jgi:hypothetical protein